MIELPFLHWMKKQTRKIDQVAVDDPPATNSLADIIKKLYELLTEKAAVTLRKYTFQVQDTEELMFSETGRGVLKALSVEQNAAQHFRLTKLVIDGVTKTVVGQANTPGFFYTYAGSNILGPNIDVYFTTSLQVYGKQVTGTDDVYAWFNMFS